MDELTNAVNILHTYTEFIRKRRERYFRRLADATAAFNGLKLITGRNLYVENSGSALMFPCIRFYEAMEYENMPLANLFVEITDDEDSCVQCRVECLWSDPTIRLTSCDPDKFMRLFSKQIARLLKVDLDTDE